MTKICVQTNVAEVDNSAIACDKIISSDCIIHADAIAYLGIEENQSLTEIFRVLMLSLIDARNRITILETV